MAKVSQLFYIASAAHCTVILAVTIVGATFYVTVESSNAVAFPKMSFVGVSWFVSKSTYST